MRTLSLRTIFCAAFASWLAAAAQADSDFTATGAPQQEAATTVSEPPSKPEGKSNATARSDQTDAIDYRAKGLLLPYGEVMKRIRKATPGDIVRVRLNKRKNLVWTYDVTVLERDGRFTLLSMNGVTGAVISKRTR